MDELPVVQPRRKGKNGTQSILIPSEKMVAAELRLHHLADCRTLQS
jgi:hypothetical protein